MQKTKLELKNLEYNAYGLTGDASVADSLVEVLESDFDVHKEGNQDFFYGKYDNLTIDDARSIKKMHESRPVTAQGKKIFVIIANNINTEAQNALLKLLEEPASYAYFFIIIPQSGLLLPTVRSRLHFIQSTRKGSKNDDVEDIVNDVVNFIKANKVKRLEIVKKIAEDISKEKKTKQYAIDFVNEIQNQIRGDRSQHQGISGQDPVKSMSSFEATQIALKYLNDRAPSVKMLLEYVALNV
jgi:DNA polymerase-3 subunit delta'